MLNDKLERLWNLQADEYNQWCDLGDDEKSEFAALVEREMSFDHQTAGRMPQNHINRMRLWTDRFLFLAEQVAQWSKDLSSKVGAVAVDSSRRIIETGYNGLPRGVNDLPERMERPAKYLWTSHAEENLVAHAARDRLFGTTVYVTHLCCCRCARMLINAGVNKVVCGGGVTRMPQEEFDIAMQMFQEAGVTVEKEVGNE